MDITIRDIEDQHNYVMHRYSMQQAVLEKTIQAASLLLDQSRARNAAVITRTEPLHLHAVLYQIPEEHGYQTRRRRRTEDNQIDEGNISAIGRAIVELVELSR